MKDRFTKNDFLIATDHFASWLADKWTFLSDTLSQYEWNKKDFNKTEEELNNLSDSLKNAFNKRDEEKLKESSINILEWGGVLNKNQDWVKGNSMLDLLENVTERWNELNNGDNVDKIKDGIRSNAGFTKIYALLLNDFIIYDSRVAAALAYYINEYYTSQNQPISEYLKFDLPVGRETENTKGRRFVSTDFKTFTRDYKRHLRSNVISSWLAQSVIQKIGDKNITVRHLEAALFMIGYDINSMTSKYKMETTNIHVR